MTRSVTAGLIVVLAVAAWVWREPLRIVYLVAAGRSQACPLSRALQDRDHGRLLTRAKDRILHDSRLLKKEAGLELWTTPKGEFWIPAGNQFVLPFNLAEMELHVYGSGDHFIHAGDIVLDCGASDGDFTREALKAGAKLVVSIEVSPQSVECLRRNLSEDVKTGRVIVYPKGVWDKEDQLTLKVVDTNFAANTVVMAPPGAHQSVTVPLTTIDHIVTRLGLPRVDFIKMDVEGAETRALAGARNTLVTYKPRLAIAAEHGPEDEVAIPRAVRSIRPDYQVECGPCLEDHGHIRSDVVHFW